ncbi:MAG: DMT family transporter [Alistipes sp.]
MRNFKGILFAILSSATFGLIPLFSLPLLHAGITSPVIIFYRLGLAALFMGLIARISHRSFRISRADFRILVLLSLFYAATSFVLLLSYAHIPTGMATTIHFLYPLVVTLVMTLFFKERKSVWLGIAVLVSLVGVGLLSWGDAGSHSSVRGIALVLVTVFTYAFYIIGIMKTRAAQIDSMILAFYVLTFGAVYFAIYALTTTGIPLIPTWDLWRNMLLLALLPTVLSNLTLVLAIKSIGSTMTSILGSMEPLTAVLIGVIHFGESFNIDSAVGLILVIVAVIIVILQAKEKSGAKR